MNAAARGILKLAVPVFVGQTFAIAGAIVDSVMSGRRSAIGLAGVGLGTGVYLMVCFTLVGVLWGVSPIVATKYGAKDLSGIGPYVTQSGWLALLLGAAGAWLLLRPDLFFLVATPPAEVEHVARDYLAYCAVGLPGLLLFRSFYGVATALGRPQVAVGIQIVALVVRIPLNVVLMDGGHGMPPLGAAGCGLSGAICAWLTAALAVAVLLRVPAYRALELRLWRGPERRILRELLRVGVPIGIAQLAEVSSFASMTLLIAKGGAVASASHQLVANFVTAVVMLPFALSLASSILLSQAVGARNTVDETLTIRSGLKLVIGFAVVLGVCIAAARNLIPRAYTKDHSVSAMASVLLVWAALAQIGDAAQLYYASLLRSYSCTLPPVFAALVFRWLIGLGLGYWLAYDSSQLGAEGFWIGSATGLTLSGLFLGAYFVRFRRLRGVIAPELDEHKMGEMAV